ncbi:hypothetical protein KEM54_000689 [Ascosphaera aggregata]|nr:hypothetical protein KEM54_000689 [Ascosphaera aggregata]
MGRSRSRTNTLGGQVASRVNIPAPITVFGGRSTSGSKNRDTMIIEGHADQDHDVDSAATDGEVNLLAAKKLSSRMAGPRSTRGRGPIRSRRVCPRPRLRLTPRSLQKFTPLRTNLESALRKLDTSTVTGCEGISGTSNRVSTGVPPKPSSRTGNDEGDLGSGMASPSLTMTSSMSSMSLLNSLSTHTPMTLTIAGRDALADRVCAAAAEALKSFQPLAKLLESFNLKGLVDDAFLESLHGGVGAPGGGSTASVRTVPESNSGSSPGSSNGNPPSGNAFANIEKPAAPRMVIGEDAFGNPILGQSTGTSTPTAMSHQFSYSHSSSVQSPSFISPSESSVSLSVPFGEPGPSNLLPSPAPGMAGSNKTQVRPLTQAEALANAFAYKQRLYDAIGALVLAAQAIGAPLADEWSTVSEETLSQDASAGDSPIRGTSLEAMDSRIGMLRGTVGMVKGILEQLSIALQILLEFEIPSEQARRRTLVVRREGMTHSPGGRNSSAVRNRRASGSVDMRMESFAESAESKGARKVRVMQMNVQPRMDKANRFFGEPTPTTASHDSAGLAGANKDHHSSQVPPLSLSGSAGISGGFNGGSVASPTHITPWFLRCDHEAEVVYEEKDGIIMLKAGSLLGLVEQLTRHDKLDTSFHSTFLLTYRSFTTATELFEHLMHRFTLPPPLGLLDEAEHALWTRMKQGPIRIRVVNTLKTWLENYWMEPNDDCEDGPTSRLLRNIQTFVQNAVFPTKTPGASQLLTLVEKRLQMGLEGKDQQVAMGRKMTPHIKSAPTPLWPKNTKRVKLLDINPEEMARQLSLIEIRLYARIKPTECLNKTWTKKSKNPDDTHNCAPNVKAMIRHSNQLTNWVAETILRQGDVKRRVAVIKFFTNVADRCGKMNNYSSLMTIISALATAPIDRLGRTWCQVSARTMATLERLRTLMQTTKNFALYRQTLHNVNPPCIPFLGIYLTDLIFTEDGIPSTADNSMINFSKWRKTAAVIQEIQQFQNGTYQFQPVPELQEWILQQMREAQDCSTKAAYDRSLEIEPREREDEKITRLLSESGFL